MRTVPNPVAIVTTCQQDVDDPDDGLLGATISSFKTVCVKPDPYVSFNLFRDSRTYKIIKEHKYFCITVPQNDVAGYRLARAFAYKNGRSALETDGDGARVQTQHWPLALEGGKPADMRHIPPTIVMSGLEHAKSNGLAFAFLCEYHDSVSAGDHVVVTGKLLPATITSASPWGRDEYYGDIFASSDMTLAYVHGFFGNPEIIGGLDQSWKMDDLYATQAADKVTGKTRRKAIKFFESRLQVIEEALTVLSGDDPKPYALQTREVARARLLSPERLLQFRKHYQDRLLQYSTALKASVTNAGYAHVNPFPQPGAQEDEQGDKEAIMLRGWKEAYVREKTLLSDAELENEENVYLARLEALGLTEDPPQDPNLGEDIVEQPGVRNVAHTPSSSSDVLNTGNAASSVSEETLSVAEAVRKQRLIEHFEERLTLIRQAKKRKAEALLHPVTPKLKYIQMTNPETQRHWENRFLGSKRQVSLDQVLNDYRTYQLQVTEARLARIQVLYQEGQYDDDLVVQLEDRIAFYEQRLDLTAQAISEKYENPDSPSLNRNLYQDAKRGLDHKNDISQDDMRKKTRNQTSRHLRAARAKHTRQVIDERPLQLEQGIAKDTQSQEQRQQMTENGVLRHFKGEEIPSANDILDLKKKFGQRDQKDKVK